MNTGPPGGPPCSGGVVLWLITGSVCLLAVRRGPVVSAWPLVKGEGDGFAADARLCHSEAVCQHLCWNASTINHKFSEEILLALCIRTLMCHNIVVVSLLNPGAKPCGL